MNTLRIAARVAARPNGTLDVDDVEAQFGAEEAQWLSGELKKFWDSVDESDYENSDNFRMAIKGGPSEAAYEDARADGCCGFSDIEIGPSPLGHTYLYGFNYGH